MTLPQPRVALNPARETGTRQARETHLASRPAYLDLPLAEPMLFFCPRSHGRCWKSCFVSNGMKSFKLHGHWKLWLSLNQTASSMSPSGNVLSPPLAFAKFLLKNLRCILWPNEASGCCVKHLLYRGFLCRWGARWLALPPSSPHHKCVLERQGHGHSPSVYRGAEESCFPCRVYGCCVVTSALVRVL